MSTTATRSLAVSPTALSLIPQTVNLDQLALVKVAQVDAMSFKELVDFVRDGIKVVHSCALLVRDARVAVRPALIRIHDMCGGQGKRNDLTGGITWTKACKEFAMLGCKRTLDALIKDAGLDNPLNPPTFAVDEEVILLADGKDRPIGHKAEVTHVHETTKLDATPKIDVAYETKDGTQTVIVPVTELQKLPAPPRKRLEVDELFILADVDGGSEFRYDDNKKMTRTLTPSVNAVQKLAHETKEAAKTAQKLLDKAAKKETAAQLKAASAAKKKLAGEKRAADRAQVAANKLLVAKTPKSKGRKAKTNP